MTTEDERLALLALARVAEPGSVAVHHALGSLGAVATWAAVRGGRQAGGLSEVALAGMAGRAAGYEPRRDLDRLHALGARAVCPGDPEWPDGLSWPVDAMSGRGVGLAPPWLLCVRGPADLRSATDRAVAVVGARAASPYGEQVASEFAFALAEAGECVVSGGAYGIDAAAHRGALAGADERPTVPTIAVLACGVDVAYPRGNERLLARIAEQGLVVSEVPPGSAPTRVRFLVRNRLIAALAQGTVVVEAALRSGSLSTAGRAEDLGRAVMAVPGPITSVGSGGCHELVRSGRAVLVTSAAEALEVVGRPGQHLLGPTRGRSDPRDGLDDQVLRVLDAVPVRQPVGVASIARTAGVAALVVQQVLPELLLAGLVEQREGAWRLSALGAGRT